MEVTVKPLALPRTARFPEPLVITPQDEIAIVFDPLSCPVLKFAPDAEIVEEKTPMFIVVTLPVAMRFPPPLAVNVEAPMTDRLMSEIEEVKRKLP